MAGIEFDARARVWLLTTANTSYVVALTDDDLPRQLHWGRPLSVDAARQLTVRGPSAISFDDGAHDGTELAGELGAQFATPSLQLRYADGSKGFAWQYVDHRIDGDSLAVQFTDKVHPIDLTLNYRIYDDSDVISRWITLRHRGDADPVTVLRADAARWTLPRLPDYRLSHVTGEWAAEFNVRRLSPPIGETVLGSRRGMTSHEANPWVMIDDGTAGEEHGEVYSAAVEFSGSWRITVRRTPSERVTITGGFGQDGLLRRLGPGEEWVSPLFSGLYATGGFGATSRAWHAHIRRHVMPHAHEVRPVLYNSWEAVTFDVSLDKQRALVPRAAAMGCELFVVDDGWFGARVSDRAGLGDWSPNPDRFPNGLTPLIDTVHEHGMRFGIWVEPEMVNPDSDLYRAHPDWVLHQAGRDRTELRNQLTLNFAREDVAEWAFGWLDKLLADNDIDFIKWDYNRPFTEAGWPDSDDADRLYDGHVHAVYRLLDRLREAHPTVRIEGCAGGGGRIDLGMLARVDQVWTSDNTDAADRLRIQHGYGQIYPARMMGAWVTDVPNGMTGRETSLRFRFHVAMAGVLAVGGNLTEWSERDVAEAAEHVALYKDIRAVVQHGEQYRLGEPGPERLSAVQYVADDRVVVIAGRGPIRFHTPLPPVRLTALDPDARYRDEDSDAVYHGSLLLSHGLPLDLPHADYASDVVRLRRI